MWKSLQKCLGHSFSNTEEKNLFYDCEWENVWQKATVPFSLCACGLWHWRHRKNEKSSKEDRPDDSTNTDAALCRSTSQHRPFPSEDVFIDRAQIWLFHHRTKSSNQAQNRNCMTTDMIFISK